jgi:hypothetical protein
MTRRRRRGIVLSFRSDPEQVARIEMKAKREGVTVSDFLRKMVERETETPASRPLRPEHEAILFDTRLQRRYLYRLLAHIFGEDEVRANSAAVKEEVMAEVRELFRAIDQDEEG